MSRLQGTTTVLVVILLGAFGLFRIAPIDVPGHLLLGRLIAESGSGLTTNLLSWTYPDHPMHQQYPLYQLGIWLLLQNFGWVSLSLFCCATWTAAGLAWMAWSGLRRCATHPGLWLLAFIGVQRHLVPRPEVFTVIGMGLLLVAWERWRSHRGWKPLAAMVVIQWFMLNTHQLFVLGLFLQVGFVAHLVLTRALAGRGWVDETDTKLPVWPMAFTTLASIAILPLSPTGFRVLLIPLALVDTVRQLGATSQQGPSSDELLPIWHEPIGGPLTAVLLLLLLVQGWRSRGRWHLYELGVVALSFALVAAALRGIPFFALGAVAVMTRWSRITDQKPLLPLDSPVHLTRVLATMFVTVYFIVYLAVPKPLAYMRLQYGLGRSIGEWGDEVNQFLSETPPPGRMLNLGWAAGYYLAFELYPEQRLFVDGRWEAYPKAFLTDCMAMTADTDTLLSMIDTWKPGFVVAEMRVPAQQQRAADLVASGRGRLVYVDSVAVVVVMNEPDNQPYLAEFAISPGEIAPRDWLPQHPILYAQQQVRVARLLGYLGADDLAAPLLVEARKHADHVAVASDLATLQPSRDTSEGIAR